jgi:hypothetical protein
MDKRRCYELASSIGLNVPRFFAPSSAEEIERVFAGLDFQKHDYLFTKPLPTGEPTDGSTRRFTRVAGIHADTAHARYMEIFERTGDLPMISEVIPGESASCIGVSLVLDSSTVRWRILRQAAAAPPKERRGLHSSVRSGRQCIL